MARAEDDGEAVTEDTGRNTPQRQPLGGGTHWFLCQGQARLSRGASLPLGLPDFQESSPPRYSGKRHRTIKGHLNGEPKVICSWVKLGTNAVTPASPPLLFPGPHILGSRTEQPNESPYCCLNIKDTRPRGRYTFRLFGTLDFSPYHCLSHVT